MSSRTIRYCLQNHGPLGTKVYQVLDMCAAPGSKASSHLMKPSRLYSRHPQTAQLLEALHINDNPTTPAIPTGVVIANDSDYKRTHMLIHQAGRLPSPCFMVTNVDAGHYPGMKIPVPGSPPEKNLSQPLLFDRILCGKCCRSCLVPLMELDSRCSVQR